MAQYPAAPDFAGPGPLDAWFTAGTIADGGARIYSMSGATFVNAVIFRAMQYLGTRTVSLSDSLVGGSFSANEMIADGTWDAQVQSALIAIAEARGLGADTLAALRAERAAQTVGRVGTTMGAWLIVDPALSAAGLASVIVPTLAGTRYPLWGYAAGTPTLADAPITVTDPANVAAPLIVDIDVFRNAAAHGGTAVPAPRPASYGKWYAAAAVAAALLYLATQGKKRRR